MNEFEKFYAELPPEVFLYFTRRGVLHQNIRAICEKAFKAGMLAAVEIFKTECWEESKCCCSEAIESIKSKAEEL